MEEKKITKKMSLSDRFYDLLIKHSIAVLVVVTLLLMYVAIYFAYLAYVCHASLQDGWLMYLMIIVCVVVSAVCLKEIFYELKRRRMVDEEDD